MSGRRLAASLIVLALLAGGCAAPPEQGRATPSGATAFPRQTGPARNLLQIGALVRSDAVRADGDLTTAKSAAKMLEAFSADLYGQLARDPGNLVFSPFSAAIALAMTRAGAAGNTAAQMDAVLHARPGELDSGFNALDRELAKRPGKYPVGPETVDLELSTANQLWGQRDAEFQKAFLDRLAVSYGAGMRVVDYVKEREASRKAINDWVSERTKSKIPELIPQGVLNELTRLVLTNAIYFKGAWQGPFSKQLTKNAPFHRLDGTDVSVPMMSFGGLPFRLYAQGPGYQAVQLPYAGGLSMVLLVPDTGSFKIFETGLTPARLGEVLGGMRSQAAIALKMPRFQFRTKAALKDSLSRLGMPTAFTEAADFSGMSTTDKFLIQAVIHEAFIAVDEDGTEAAAATGIAVGVTSRPSQVVELTVDRPFLFLIRDDATGAILFMGRVVDPS